MNNLKTVELRDGVSLLEVSKQLRAAGSIVLRAIWRKRSEITAGHWAVQFTGPEPSLIGLAD